MFLPLPGMLDEVGVSHKDFLLAGLDLNSLEDFENYLKNNESTNIKLNDEEAKYFCDKIRKGDSLDFSKEEYAIWEIFYAIALKEGLENGNIELKSSSGKSFSLDENFLFSEFSEDLISDGNIIFKLKDKTYKLNIKKGTRCPIVIEEFGIGFYDFENNKILNINSGKINICNYELNVNDYIVEKNGYKILDIKKIIEKLKVANIDKINYSMEININSDDDKEYNYKYIRFIFNFFLYTFFRLIYENK